ncbi:MAG: NfeD family protein [Clostridiales bacterium]|nr:NfeD family protein [Candidatus Crickella merdequi]
MDNTLLIAWLVILVVLVIVELMTMGLTTIWFAGGALAGLILALVGAPLWLQIVVALVVSVILLFFTRPIAVKYFNKDRVRTNAESLIGRAAVVIGEIDNLHNIGQVNVGGQEWSARSYAEDVIIEPGTVVEILSISGVKLIVKPRQEEN